MPATPFLAVCFPNMKHSYGTTSTGTHVANAANTGNGYARITYLGT